MGVDPVAGAPDGPGLPPDGARRQQEPAGDPGGPVVAPLMPEREPIFYRGRQVVSNGHASVSSAHVAVVHAGFPAPPSPVLSPAPRPSGLWRPVMWRRGWILLLAMVAGALGGHVAGARHAPSYTAQATLVIPAATGSQGPGDANDAAALAISYATFIPQDRAILDSAARRLGVSSSVFDAGVSITAESGTSVMLLKYATGDANDAIRGARALALSIADTPPAGSGVATGSVDVVKLPTSASSTVTIKKYATPVGALLGLIVGAICVTAAERADPRIDDEQQLVLAADCPANEVPGPIPLAELARGIALHRDEDGPVTVLPLTKDEVARTGAFVDGLRDVWPWYMPATEVTVGDHLETGSAELGRQFGSTVLVVSKGSARRRVTGAVHRLTLLGQAPVWAVLVSRHRALPWRRAQ